MPDRTLSRSAALASTLLPCFMFVSSVSGQATTHPPLNHDALVATHCGTCHRKGGSGPFTLETSSDLLKRRQFIKAVIESGLMPPWPYSGGVELEGERTLSADQKRRFLELLSSGVSVEAGDILKEDEGVQAPDHSSTVASEATLGPFGMRRSWAVPAEGGRRWFKGERDKRTFLIPIAHQAPLRINQLAYRTTAPLAVTAVALSADATGQARRYIDWDDDSGTYMAGDVGFVAAGSLAVIGPGGGSLALPSGYHLTLPAGADIVSEVHFRPQGKEWTLDDSVTVTQVAADVDSTELVPINLMLRKVVLAAGETLDAGSELTLEQDVSLVAITPRAGRRCTRLRLELVMPDGLKRTTLLDAKDWNPHYRETVVLKEPLTLPRGTRFIATWHFDNSSKNPRNPVVPPEDVSLGARCGIANFLLLCASDAPGGETSLKSFARSEVIRKQR